MIDKQNMLAVLEDFPSQIKKGYELGEKIEVKGVDKILFCGMGGSGLPSDIIKTFFRDVADVPVYVHKSYGIPKFVDKKTLVFVTSYSGNTEETLSAYKEAKDKAQIIAVTSGGKLKDNAKQDNKTIIEIPEGIQPRLAVGYMTFAMLRVLENSGFVKIDVEEVVKKLQNPHFKMKGEELATSMEGRLPVIYGSDTLYMVAEMWKIAINENAKTNAFYNYFPELNHNELLGWTRPNGDFKVIMVREDDCHRRIQKRFKITKDIISEEASCTEVVIKGSSQLVKIFSAIYMAYWSAYFLALKYGVDPTPVELIEELKKKL